MSSVIKTNASALREKNDRDLPRNSLNVNSKRGSPVSENEHEKTMHFMRNGSFG